MAHRNRWFSQLETSIYKGFSMAMLNNQRVFIQKMVIYSSSMICLLEMLIVHS